MSANDRLLLVGMNFFDGYDRYLNMTRNAFEEIETRQLSESTEEYLKAALARYNQDRMKIYVGGDVTVLLEDDKIRLLPKDTAASREPQRKTKE